VTQGTIAQATSGNLIRGFKAGISVDKHVITPNHIPMVTVINTDVAMRRPHEIDAAMTEDTNGANNNSLE